MVGKNPDKSDYICSLIFGHLDDGTPLVINLITTPHLLVVGGNGNGRHKILSQLTDVHWPREKVIIECPIEEEGMFARLEWLSEELERRYRLIADAGLVRIGDYNINHPYDCQPYIVFVVSLLDSIKDQPRFEAYVRRIAAKAKSVGIHFIFFARASSTVQTWQRSLTIYLQYSAFMWRRSVSLRSFSSLQPRARSHRKTRPCTCGILRVG